MANLSTYSVIVSGQIKEGADPANIQSKLATLLKVTPEKAAQLMQRQWVIKKNIDEQTADKYKKKLESIGLIIGLKEHAPPPPAEGGLSLTLEPTGTEEQSQEKPATAESDSDVTTCPKCGNEQSKTIEQCQSCGVYLSKLMPQPSKTEAPQSTNQEEENDHTATVDEENLTGKSIVAGVAAALVGAIVWNIIGNVFDYELGIIAWGIGGAIGYAVAMTGSRGDKAAMVCAALALFSILGGKYILYSSYADNFSELISENMNEIRVLYDEQVQKASAYSSVTDEETLRQYMVDYQFSDSSNPDAITDEEINTFKADVEPFLVDFEIQKPGFEEWVNDTLENSMGDISAMELLKENFGFLDIVFLFLGVGTAFRLGRGLE